MKPLIRHGIFCLALIGAPVAGLAQPVLPGAIPPPPKPPSAEALGLARTLVAKNANGDVAALPFMGSPIGHLLRGMGITDPQQSRAVIEEAIVPVLKQHAAELAEIEAQADASVLSLDDMKAAIVFYDSPAGKKWVGIHSPLLAMNLVAVTQLLNTLKPEIQAKLQSPPKPPAAPVVPAAPAVKK